MICGWGLWNNVLDSGPDMLFLMTFIIYFAIHTYNEVKLKQSPPN